MIYNDGSILIRNIDNNYNNIRIDFIIAIIDE